MDAVLRTAILAAAAAIKERGGVPSRFQVLHENASVALRRTCRYLVQNRGHALSRRAARNEIRQILLQLRQ